jgi:acyl dehydratase
MPARKLYFDAVRVGEELPPLTKAALDRVQLSRYAGASGDYNPVHVDELAAKAAGMPSVYAPGMLVMGLLGHLLTDWARGAQVRRFGVKFVKMAWPGDTVVCKGRVTDRWGEGGRYFAELDLWAENQRGELLLKGQAALQLFYSLEDENRQRSGNPPVVVDVPRESLRTQVTDAAAAVKKTAAAAGPVEAARKQPPARKEAPREKPAGKTSGAKKPKKD